MIQRVLNSKNFLACLFAAATGMFLYIRMPFPEDNLFFELMFLWARPVFQGFKYTYVLFLSTTPYIVYSILFSGLYIFALKIPKRIRPGRLPAYPDPRKRTALSLVIGEIHNPRKPTPAKNPYWLIIPERGLFTGIAIFGATGSGKTTCSMYPFAEQILAYKADDKEKRIGGLVLEVKGDFCKKIKEILVKHERAEDYIEIGLGSQYRYNPFHNDLDAYALAYSIASLLNNLFGKGKEPFWQQAYTNLVKFIILLHKITYDYVTLFDVYRCAISPPLLEERIQEAEEIIMGRHFAAVTPEVFGKRPIELTTLGFKLNADLGMYKASSSPGLRDILRKRSIASEPRTVRDPSQADPDKLEMLEAVKRWFNDDWSRIEPKLRTSIVEGVSVFLSLFDDNPKVKKVFCP